VTLQRKPADLAMVDLRMPDINVPRAARQIRTSVPGCEVILMTAYGSVDSAVERYKLGAREYLTKPFDFDAPAAGLSRSASSWNAAPRSSRSKARSRGSSSSAGCSGRSPCMQEVFSLIHAWRRTRRWC
jgi:two-component system response regulator HydG